MVIQDGAISREAEFFFFTNVICNGDKVVALGFLEVLVQSTGATLVIPNTEYERFANELHNLAGSCGLMGFTYWSKELSQFEHSVTDVVSCVEIKTKVTLMLKSMALLIDSNNES
ncbi:hypothetical protein [Vibrio lentus]|uniref:hypothetical protein n=1 Tax=Vibrio lentus TaxID=136468 RepID=UPI00178C86A8|nr:hypothetical protein [Vibrio lentus]MDN3628305.1 hypothetical protein [Vibrio lentus]